MKKLMMEILKNVREELAALEHEQWSHWMAYLLDNLDYDNIKRWKRQMNTPYSELTEKEKDSDRVWADKVLDIIKESE